MTMMTSLSSLPPEPWLDLSPNQRQDLTVVFLSALLAWTLLFLFFKNVMFPKRSYDFNNRMVSLVHVVVAMALSSAAIDWSNPLRNLGGPNTSAEVLTMIISQGYFVYDMFGCLADSSTADLATTFHHVATILGFSFGLFYGKCGTDLCCCLWVMELSNPFMHLREIFKELNMTNPTLLLGNDALFVLMFTIARVGIAPVGTYKVVMGTSSTGVKVGAVGIQLVNFLWFAKIVRFAYFKLLKKSKPKAKPRSMKAD